MSVNKVILIGRLGSDPETKTTEKTTIAKFSIATSNGKEKEPDWHNIVAFGKTAELVSKYLSKGSNVYIEGKLETRNWTNDAGEKRYATEVVAFNVTFLDSKPKEEAVESDLPF
jgi:single-strand DNA-binding protein